MEEESFEISGYIEIYKSQSLAISSYLQHTTCIVHGSSIHITYYVSGCDCIPVYWHMIVSILTDVSNAFIFDVDGTDRERTRNPLNCKPPSL